MATSRDLRSLEWITKQAALWQAADLTRQTAGLPRGTVRGTICSVDDPENRGRVCVIFDDMNPDCPQVYGAGEYSKEREGKEPDKSHWIDVCPAFKGRQPKGMEGKRVNINVSNGQFQFAVLVGGSLCDPQMLAEGKGKDLEMPNNTSMTRLPVYPSGELPPATAENVGCVVIEEGGFDGMQWLSVCLQRSGGYTWVNLMDRLHIHDSQANDSAGDSEGTVNDDTHATT